MSDAQRFDLLVRGGICVTDGTAAEADVEFSTVHRWRGSLPNASAAEIGTRFARSSWCHRQLSTLRAGSGVKEGRDGDGRAAPGGVTAICEMPNTKPSATTAKGKSAAGTGGWTTLSSDASAENADQLDTLENDFLAVWRENLYRWSGQSAGPQTRCGRYCCGAGV